MNVPGGLAESAAAMLVRLMVVELAGVDIGYVARFAALDTTGDAREVRGMEARLTTDARCLEASLTAGLSQVTNVVPVELGFGLQPLSAPQVESRWRDLIKGLLTRGRLRAAELNAFLAEFADAAEDGHRLLGAIINLDESRHSLWRDTSRPSVLPARDLERLQRLDVRRRQLIAHIRSRYPVTVRAAQVQTAMQLQYESQRAELLAAQASSTEDQAGYAFTIEQLDSAHALALRRQSVPQYEITHAEPPPSVASGPMAEAAGQLLDSVLTQLEQQRVQLVAMRDKDLTAAGRAAYEQAIAQIDIGMETVRRQLGPVAAEVPPDMTEDEQRASARAIADVTGATAQLKDLAATMQAGSEVTNHLLGHMNQLAGMNADLNAAHEERSNAHRAVLNAKAAVDSARLAGLQSDYRHAVAQYEQIQRRLDAAETRVAELQARAQEQQERLLGGPGLPG